MPYADPDMQRTAQREHARRKRSMGTVSDTERRTAERDVEPIVEPLVPSHRRITYAHDVLAMLADHAHAVEASQSADSLMKARAIAQIATPMLRAIESRDAAIDLTIEERLANLNDEVRERCADHVAGVVRAVLAELPLTTDQRADAPEIAQRALRRYGLGRPDRS